MLAGGVRLMYDGSRVPVHALELQALRVTDTELLIEVLQDGESIWLGVKPNGSITEISGALEAADQATGELGSFQPCKRNAHRSSFSPTAALRRVP